MKKLQLSLCALGAYVLLVAGFGIAGSRPATGQATGKGLPPGPDVRVINGSSEPVPVTLSGTGTITGNVNITNTPTVKLDSSESVPVSDVDSPARQPFVYQKVGSFDAGLLGPNLDVDVPAGKRLVIEFASFQASIPQGQFITFLFITVEGTNGSSKFYVPAVYQGATFIGGQNVDLYTAATPMRLYADPGTKVTLALRRNKDDGTGLGSASISGYLVDVP